MNIETLLKTNVNDHIEKKNNLSYLSWAWAWAEALKADPKAVYKVEMFGDKCYMDINGTAMVWVTVTMFDKQMTCQLPVMNHKNQAIPNPDAFAVNTAIMRCMTKALSLHGLGLYIYAGDDLPEDESKKANHSLMQDHITAIREALAQPAAQAEPNEADQLPTQRCALTLTRTAPMAAGWTFQRSWLLLPAQQITPIQRSRANDEPTTSYA